MPPNPYDMSGGWGSSMPRYDVYDMPNAGPVGAVDPRGQSGMAPQESGWTQFLKGLAQQQMLRGQGQSQGPGGGGMLQQPQSASQQGFISNSRQGFGLDSLAKLASLVYSGGASGLLGAGAQTAAANGTGLMGTLGGFLGQGGGQRGGQSPMGGNTAFAPTQPGPLMPQGVAQWQQPAVRGGDLFSW